MLLQWVEIELLATVGWKCGFQPFSCPCSQNVTLPHCRKEIFSTCLSKDSMPFVKYKSTPNQKLEVPESGSTLYQLCIMVASCPCLRCSCRTNQSYTEKQRVWSRSCGLQDLFRNIPISDCSMWPLQNTEWFWRLSFYPRWVGLPAFQLPMFSKCGALLKGDLLDMFVSGVHSCHSFGKCQASTPYQKLKVAESGSTLHQLCIMLVLCLQKIPSLCRRFRICVSIELLATVGGKCGFQPFSCPCSQNVTLPKRGFLDILV